MRENLKHSLIYSIVSLFILFTIIVVFAIINDKHTDDDDIITTEEVVDKIVAPVTTELQESMEEIDTTIPPVIADTPVVDESEPSYLINKEDVEYIAKTLYGECRGIPSDAEKAAVAWCILNRVDARGYGFGNSIGYVVTFPHQFYGYNEDFPIIEELYALAEDVLIRWYAEKSGEKDVGRTLPPDYLWFYGDGRHNYFVNEYGSSQYWDWSLENPYED